MREQSVRERKRKDIFQKLLVSMWLRPERALFDAHILEAVYHLGYPYFQGTILEFGCLDGIPTFAMLGGKLAYTYDDYENISRGINENKKEQRFSSKFDYYDSFDECSTTVPIESPPLQKFSYGCSYKRAHIEKSKRLNLYKVLWEQELTEILPVTITNLDLIYAPMLFWLRSEGQLFRLMRSFNNALKSEGKVIAAFPKIPHEPYLIFKSLPNLDPAWREIIESGIPENLTRLNMTLEQLQTVFDKTGFHLESSEEVLPTIISQIYQIGFRPFFPALLDMRERLVRVLCEREILSIKTKWIELLQDFMFPLCENSWMNAMGMQNTWRVFCLKKS